MRRTFSIAVLALPLLFVATVPACAQPAAPPSQCAGEPPAAPAAQAGAARSINLAEQLSARRLRAENRDISPLEGSRAGVRVDAQAGPGVVWIEGTDVADGTIDVVVCGRDVPQQSFLGLAFHRRDDETYEAVYVRPFNFRADDATRHHHAVQYISVPDYDWPRLRQDFPEQFENAVDASVSPTAWIPLRLVLDGPSLKAYVGSPTGAPALDIERLSTTGTGQVGLWVGNGSDGVFANLRVVRKE
jgi:hypothetical protein